MNNDQQTNTIPFEEEMPRGINTELLTNLKTKMSGSVRRGLMKACGKIISVGTEKGDPILKLARKFQSLSIFQLARRIVQSKNRAERERKILKKMAKSSPFRPAIEDSIIHSENLGMFARREAMNRRHDGDPNNDNNIIGASS